MWISKHGGYDSGWKRKKAPESTQNQREQQYACLSMYRSMHTAYLDCCCFSFSCSDFRLRRQICILLLCYNLTRTAWRHHFTPYRSIGRSLSAAGSPWLRLWWDVEGTAWLQDDECSAVRPAMCAALKPAGIESDKSIGQNGKAADQRGSGGGETPSLRNSELFLTLTLCPPIKKRRKVFKRKPKSQAGTKGLIQPAGSAAGRLSAAAERPPRTPSPAPKPRQRQASSAPAATRNPAAEAAAGPSRPMGWALRGGEAVTSWPCGRRQRGESRARGRRGPQPARRPPAPCPLTSGGECGRAGLPANPASRPSCLLPGSGDVRRAGPRGRAGWGGAAARIGSGRGNPCDYRYIMALCKGGVRSFERPRAAAGIGPGGRGEACGKLGSEHEVCAAKTKPRDPGLPWGCSDNRGFEPFPKQSCVSDASHLQNAPIYRSLFT